MIFGQRNRVYRCRFVLRQLHHPAQYKNAGARWPGKFR